MGLYFAVHITHWSELRRTRNHILLFHLRLTLPGGPYPQEQGGPVKPPGHRVPCLSPLMTCRVMVEVF
jgi:hypothetical protein